MTSFSDRLRRRLSPRPCVSVIRLHGAIGLGGPLGRSLDDSSLAPVIERAFDQSRLKAVALSINSPGGSPTQSALIAARIRRLAEEKEVKVHAFCEDVAASGGYWLACAGDDIHADANAILGSIGVISAGFGLQEAIKRLGVERRVRTAGERKGLFDPFREETPEDVARVERLLKGIHANFIDHVKARRGERLRGGSDHLFSGEVWLAGEAAELGLIDGVGHLVPTMKALYGDRVRFHVARPKKPLLRRLGGASAMEFGAELADGAAAALEARAMRARWGL